MRDAWTRLPWWARWLVAYAALLGGSSGVGALTIGAATAVFFAGALTILYSLTYIRLGGDSTVIARPLLGRPVWGRDPVKRSAELRQGLGIFALGAALWATLAVIDLVL